MTAERVGAPVGYGFSLVDTTPYARGKHYLEFINGRVLGADHCDLRLAKDRERCADGFLAVVKTKRKPRRDRVLGAMLDFYAASTAQPPPQPEEPGPEADLRSGLDVGEGDLSVLTTTLRAKIKEANNPPKLFTYGTALARIITDEDGHPAIEPLDLAGVTCECAELVAFYKTTLRGHVAVSPPHRLMVNLVASRQRGAPAVRGVSTVPLYGPNASLILQPGYDAPSRLVYLPEPGLIIPPVPPVPTEANIKEACGLILDETLGDFPFSRKSDRAHAVAAMELPFVRALIRGATPAHGFEAPSFGTGKTLLASVVCVPYGGHVEVSVLAGTEEEIRKQITAVALESPTFYLLDNVEGEINSGVLSAALTSTTWKDRILGQSRMAHLPIRWVWLLTATNPLMGTQMARRYVRCRLDAKSEEPWRRAGFKHPDLLQWVSDHRGELIWACLVLAQNWLAQGRPEGTTRLGTYESWSKVMGGILATAGIDGFLEDLDQLYDRADAQRGTWRAFIALWANTHGTKPVKVSELLPLAASLEDWDWGRSETEQGQKVALGHALAKKEGYVIADYEIVRGRAHDNSQTWQLRTTSDSGTNDSRTADAPDDKKVF